MRVVYVLILFWTTSSALAQKTLITTGEIPLGIEVRKSNGGERIDISSMAPDFDINNIPLNMVLPEGSYLTIFLPNTKPKDSLYYWQVFELQSMRISGSNATGNSLEAATTNSKRRIKRHDFSYNDEPVLVAFQGILESASLLRLQIEKYQKSQAVGTFNMSWLTVRADKKLSSIESIFLNSEVPDILITTSNADNNDKNQSASSFDEKKFERERLNYQNWINKGYCSGDFGKTLPRNPVFPYYENSLFFKLSDSSPFLNIYLEKDGIREELESPFNFSSNTIYLKELETGHYKLII